VGVCHFNLPRARASGQGQLIQQRAPGAAIVRRFARELGALLGRRRFATSAVLVTDQIADLEGIILRRRWFYNFRLRSGRVTESYLPSDVLPIHETRLRMLWQALEPIFGGIWPNTTAVDLACHEGFFAVHLAERGCKRVLGIDGRAEHVRNAALVRDALGRDNLEYRVGNLETIRPAELGDFDLCLLFGILYHVENIVGVLRLARAVTRRLCLIETQVCPELKGGVDWGSHHSVKQICGTIVMVDETSELSAGNREANVSPISLVPSVDALRFLLGKLGFQQIDLVTPPADAYSQLLTGKRVVIAAQV
jgi:tRNA (mo5U34)-methyltransferase